MPQQVPAVQLSHSHGWHRPGPSSEDKLPAANACSAAMASYCVLSEYRDAAIEHAQCRAVTGVASRELVSCECLPG